MPDALEYEEEDLFVESEGEGGGDIELLSVNPATPIAGPSVSKSRAGSGAPSSASNHARGGSPQSSSLASSSRSGLLSQASERNSTSKDGQKSVKDEHKLPWSATLGSIPSSSTSTSTSKPISHLPPAQAMPRPRDPQQTREHLAALEYRRNAPPPPPPTKGVPSLARFCMTVCKENAPYQESIGDLEYPLVAEFINIMSKDQLTMIENNSPHIKKDTDWLWEYFLIVEHPWAHDRAAYKHGERRTSGWRRMYTAALTEYESRFASATERMRNSYDEIQRNKDKKRIKVIDGPVMEGKRRKAVGGVMGQKAGPSESAMDPGDDKGDGGSGRGSNRSAGLLGKARADTQRARIAMTHSHGRFIAPSSRSAMAQVPIGVVRPPKSPLVARPRPASAVAVPHAGPSRAPAPAMSPQVAPSSPDRYTPAPSALPAHLTNAAAQNYAASTANRLADAERESIAARPRGPQVMRVPQALVQNFRPPSRACGPRIDDGEGGGAGGKREKVDFFGQRRGEETRRGAAGMPRLPSTRAGGGEATEERGKKRHMVQGSDGTESDGEGVSAGVGGVSGTGMGGAVRGAVNAAQTRVKVENGRPAAGMPRTEAERLSQVLFRKKSRPGAGRSGSVGGAVAQPVNVKAETRS